VWLCCRSDLVVAIRYWGENDPEGLFSVLAIGQPPDEDYGD
jgi:hypothetical protein